MDIQKLIGDQTIDIDCPNCEHQFPVKFKELSVEGNTLQCPACQATIGVAHKEDFDSEIKSGNKSLNNFEQTIKNLGK